jgi:HK97 family phage major capsid protein
MSFEHIAHEVFAEPWMILPEKLAAISELVALRISGTRLSDDEIRSNVPSEVAGACNEPYLVASDGARLDWSVFSESASSARSAAASSKGAGLIAVLPISGTIFPKANLMSDFSGGTSIETLTKRFRQAVESPDVRAIVLDVDSPGGSVYGVDELASEIYAARDRKKIVAQVNPLAASAAYYLASQAAEVAMTPSGEAGSIGVFLAHRDVSRALDNNGVRMSLVSAGKYKTEGNPYEPLSSDARAFLQQRVNEYYDAFVKAVARGRESKVNDVRNGFGEGRVVGADDAKRLGMIDRVSTLDETIARLGGNANARVEMAASSSHTASAAVAAISESLTLADERSGRGPQGTSASADKTTEVSMSTTTTPAAAVAEISAVRENAIKADSDRIAAIQSLARQHAGVVSSTQVSEWVRNGTSVHDAKEIVLSRLSAASVPVPGVSSGDPLRVEVREHKFEEMYAAHVATRPKGRECFTLTRALRAFAMAKGDLQIAHKIAEQQFGDKLAASALSAGDQATGGFLVPSVLAEEVIEFLRPQAVVRSLNPTMAPLVNGQLNLSKMTGGSTATYIGENKNAPATNPTFGLVKATAKKLAALVPISNDLVRYTGPGTRADQITRDDLVRAFAQAEDSAFIRGVGSNYSPKGLKNWVPAANLKTATNPGTLANARLGLGALRLALRTGNVGFTRPGWVMSPRIENFLLFNCVDGNGNLVFGREMMDRGTLLNYPYRVTTLIPENLGGGSNEAEIYFADFADVVIAENPQVIFEISTEAAYDPGTGTLVSAFQLDQTLLKMIVEHDLVVRHAESIAMLQTVQWA